MLQVKNIVHQYEQSIVLNGIDLDVEKGEILCLLGASGSGKSTLLRIVAGLESGYQGSVIVANESVDKVPVHQRDFGLMFQEFALFPHMTVEQNIAFGLRMHNVSKQEQAATVKQVLELVDLVGFEKRAVTQLSGGERQRVALARSLAPEPRLLMLDEPLGSLDAALRDNLVLQLRDIIKKTGLTSIYVTHDQQEAYAIADRIAVMNSGKIEQIDTPQQLYRQPKTAFVARFLGFNNIFSREKIAKFLDIDTDAELILIHPDGIQIAENDDPNAIDATIIERVFRGDHYEMLAKLSDDVSLQFDISSFQDNKINSKVSLIIFSNYVIGLT